MIEKKQNNFTIKKKREIGRVINDIFGWLITVIVFSILGASYFFLLLPKQQEIADLERASIDKLNQDYIKNQGYLKELVYLGSVYREIDQGLIDRVSSIIPDEDVHEELFDQINNLVKKNGLLVESLDINLDTAIASKQSRTTSRTATEDTAVSLPADIGFINVELNVMGTDYDSLKNLLASFENNLRLVDIEEVQFDPKTNKTILKFKTYYYKG